MAKIKGYNPPVKELSYKDADGVLHYLGEYIRDILSDPFIDPRDPESDIAGASRRGDRPTQQGWGTKEQERHRKNFLNCTILWNSLPELCPDPVGDPPSVSKESVWLAKLEYGVVCSYYDLFLRCCIKYAQEHDDAMPDGDCFPCPSDCTPDPEMAWDEETSAKTINREDSVTVAITGLNGPFTWSVAGLDFTLAALETEGLENLLIAGPDACGSATITVTGCDDTEAIGYVRCTAVSSWQVVSPYSCPIPGDFTLRVDRSNSVVDFYRDVGKYRVKISTRCKRIFGAGAAGCAEDCVGPCDPDDPVCSNGCIGNILDSCTNAAIDCRPATQTNCGNCCCSNACDDPQGSKCCTCTSGKTLYEWKCN